MKRVLELLGQGCDIVADVLWTGLNTLVKAAGIGAMMYAFMIMVMAGEDTPAARLWAGQLSDAFFVSAAGPYTVPASILSFVAGCTVLGLAFIVIWKAVELAVAGIQFTAEWVIGRYKASRSAT